MIGGKALNIALWIAQILLAIPVGFFGGVKATQPLDQVAVLMKWVPTVSPLFVRTLGVAEMLGAIGLILPSATRIVPRLTVAAALCCAVVQALAIGLHASRGETAETVWLNLILVALALFVLWGRSARCVITPRA